MVYYRYGHIILHAQKVLVQIRGLYVFLRSQIIYGRGKIVVMDIETIKKEYPYVYETHLHTAEGSACGKNTGAEMARACKEYGYAGIIVTDHNWYGNTAVDRDLPWEEWVTDYCKGYEHAKEEGDKIGLDVFFGYEAGYHGPEFLIYGIDKNMLINHPEIKDASPAEQYKIVHGLGGLVIQAHPFRRAPYIKGIELFPEDCDGVETINAAHSEHWRNGETFEWDVQALEYAGEHDFMMTAGSDIHWDSPIGGGMAFKEKLTSIEDFVTRVKSRKDYLLTDGELWYDPMGRRVL